MKRASTALCLFCALGIAACGDDPKPPPQKLPPAVTAAIPADAGAARASGAAGAPARAEPSSPLPKPDFPEDEFTESATRSRDPFRSFASDFVSQERVAAVSQRDVVLGDFPIDELKVSGIVSRSGQPKAMLVDPQGKGFVIRRGQFVGRADVVQLPGSKSGSNSYELNWRVDRIRDQDVVLVREDPAHPDVPTATRVIALRPEGEAEK